MQNAEKINHKNQEGQPLVKGLTNIVEHLVALAAVSLLSYLAAKLGSQYFEKISDMIFWGAIVLAIAAFGHALLISLHYLFPHGINFQRKLAPHLAVYLLLSFLLMATSSATLFLVDKKGAGTELKAQYIALLQSLRSANEKITDNGKIEDRYIQDILAVCVNSIMKKSARSVRATVVYLDTAGQYLIMPQNGFYGEGFDSDLPQKLFFHISDKSDKESTNEFLSRLGYAGWTFKNDAELIDNNIGERLPSEPIFKDEKASEKLQKDFGVICVPIYKTVNSKRKVIGVLSVSSPESKDFTEEEIETARYFANLLSRYDEPIKTPEWLRDAKK